MSAYQFKIQINGIKKPPIWRRLLVPSDYTFTDLAQVIKVAFEWDGPLTWQYECRDRDGQIACKISKADQLGSFEMLRALVGEMMGREEFRYDPDETTLRMGEDLFVVHKTNFLYGTETDKMVRLSITPEETLDRELDRAECTAASGAPVSEELFPAKTFQTLKEEYARGIRTDEKLLAPYLTESGDVCYKLDPGRLETINKALETDVERTPVTKAAKEIKVRPKKPVRQSQVANPIIPTSDKTVYQLKVQLRGYSKPPVWRRLVVPGDKTFTELAEAIMHAFDWTGLHLWSFECRDRRGNTVVTIEEENEDNIDERDNPLQRLQKHLGLRQSFYDSDETPVSQLPEITEGLKLYFIYDFGSWVEHIITLENVVPGEPKSIVLVKSSGRAPEEDLY